MKFIKQFFSNICNKQGGAQPPPPSIFLKLGDPRVEIFAIARNERNRTTIYYYVKGDATFTTLNTIEHVCDAATHRDILFKFAYKAARPGGRTKQLLKD